MMYWLIFGRCPDYYCSCGDGHLLGMANSAADAEALAMTARTRRRISPGTAAIDYGEYLQVDVVGPIEPGKLVEQAFNV